MMLASGVKLQEGLKEGRVEGAGGGRGEAGGDSEGSLGGLVRQGESGNLETTILAAVKNAEFCASDPLCLESEGQGYYGLNLAACHACTLLPETACELGNRVLDRALIVGSEANPQGGYFSDLIHA